MTDPFVLAVRTLSELLDAQVVVVWHANDEGPGTVIASSATQITRGRSWEPPPDHRRDGFPEPQLVTEVGQLAHFLPADVRLSQSPPLAAVLCAPLGRDDYRVTAGFSDAPAPDVGRRLDDPAVARVLDDLRRADALARAEATSLQLTQVLASLSQAVALTSLDGTPGWVNAAAASLLHVPAGAVPAAELSAALTSLRTRALNPLETEAVSLRLALDSRASISNWLWSFEEEPTHLRVTTVALDGRVGFGRSWVFDDMSVEMQALDGERQTVARLEASDAQLRTALEVVSTSEDLLRATVEGTLDPQALLAAVRDDQGRVVDYTYLLVNDAALAEWARPREQVVGRRLLQVFPRADVRLMTGLTATLSSGDTLVLDDLEVSAASRSDKPRFLNIRATRAPGDRLSVSWANVTQRREASAALEASNRELAEAQRLAHAGSWSLDTATGEVTCSVEMTRILGRLPGSEPSRLTDIESHLDAPTRHELRAAIADATTGGRAIEMEFDLVRPDGERRHVRGRVEPVSGRTSSRGEAPGRVRGTLVDVTEAHLAAESRARRVARHADYLARVEHTLRTNLSVVEGWAGILEADFDSLEPSIRATAVTAMRRNATALVGHVQALMNGAAQDARAESLVIEPVDIVEIALSVAADYQGLTHRTVTTSTGGRLRALGSPEALDTVIRHLVENAIRHTGDDGLIDVAVQAAGGHTIDVVVRDDGPGIADGVPLFSAFSKSATSKGHGLGLHVVQTLVEAMGGHVEGHNRADGGGAEFVVTLRQEES